MYKELLKIVQVNEVIFFKSFEFEYYFSYSMAFFRTL